MMSVSKLWRELEIFVNLPSSAYRVIYPHQERLGPTIYLF